MEVYPAKGLTMEVTAVVLYDKALAHYEVEIGQDGVCTARLAKYNGSPQQSPPTRMQLVKEGRRWWSTDVPDENLAEDIGYAVELKAKPLLDDRRRGGHPAG